MRQKKQNSSPLKPSNISKIKNIDADIEKFENEAKQMLARMEHTLKDLRQLNTESDPNKRFEVFLENIITFGYIYIYFLI